jgi:RNA polymerase sigma-70 factor (ECF subfamily)
VTKPPSSAPPSTLRKQPHNFGFQRKGAKVQRVLLESALCIFAPSRLCVQTSLQNIENNLSDLRFDSRFSLPGIEIVMQLSRHLHQKIGQFVDSVCGKWISSPAFPSHSGIPPEEEVATPSSPDVTQLLKDWRNGDQQALERLTPLVYGELRRLAARYLRRERADHTLQATALVNEAYVQLIGQQEKDWQNRAHFIGVAAHLMRKILVDHARAHATAKRGGGEQALPLDEAIEVPGKTTPDVLALDDALTDLANRDERKSRIIELRYFGGLQMEEIAEITHLSVATLRRELRMAEAWLGRQLQKQ